MDPGQQKEQHGDQLEARSVALPADGSPTLEEHQGDGKDLGKVSSNVFPDTMVSGDHVEESRCSSPPLSIDCTTSSSSSSSQDDWATSFDGSCISSSSGSSTNIFSEDEVGSEWTTSYGSISTTSCSPTVDRPYAELEMAQTSFESTHGFDKREEPILSSDDSRVIGISQCHQVGLVGDVPHVTSVTSVNRKRTRDSDSEEEPPAKRNRDSDVAEEELPSKRTRDSDVVEEELPSKRTRKSDYAEEEPSAKSTRDNQTREELPSKRTRDSDSEEEIPPKRSRNSDDEEEPVLSPSTNTLCEDPLQSTPVSSPSPMPFWVDPIFSPISLSPKSACEDPILFSPVSNPSPVAFWLDHFQSPFSISPESTSEDPILSSPVFSPSPTMPCEGPIVSVHAITPPIIEDSVSSSPVLSRSPKTVCEDPIVSSSVVRPSPSPYCKIPSSAYPCICVWMKTHMDKEEEPMPSTSGIGSDRIRERVSSRQVWFRPNYDLSSDDSD